MSIDTLLLGAGPALLAIGTLIALAFGAAIYTVCRKGCVCRDNHHTELK